VAHTFHFGVNKTAFFHGRGKAKQKAKNEIKERRGKKQKKAGDGGHHLLFNRAQLFTGCL